MPHEPLGKLQHRIPQSLPSHALFDNQLPFSMYGARYGSYGSSETVALPSGMGPGAVIGKGAGNIKMLGQRTGARFDVRANSVVITGSSSAVAEGVKMLKEQISAFTGQGDGMTG